MVKKTLWDFRYRLDHQTSYTKQKWENDEKCYVNVKAFKTGCIGIKAYVFVSIIKNVTAVKKHKENNLVITCEDEPLKSDSHLPKRFPLFASLKAL